MKLLSTCCVKDTWGSQIVPAVQGAFAQQTDDESLIVKHCYDAFEQLFTSLNQ